MGGDDHTILETAERRRRCRSKSVPEALKEAGAMGLDAARQVYVGFDPDHPRMSQALLLL
jgi:hypothetical protein